MKKKHVLGSIQVTRRCNKDCIFCAAPHSETDLPIEEIKRTIVGLKENGATEIMLSGGEPTMREDLKEIVSFAFSKGYEEVSIQTNGSRLHDIGKLMDLRSAGPFKFDISFHSHEKATFDRISGKEGMFEDFIRFLDNVKRLDIPAYYTTVINSLNYTKLKEQVLFSKIRYPNITHFSFNFIDPINKAIENKWIVPRLSACEPFMHEAFSHLLKSGMSFRIEFVPLCFLGEFMEFSSELRREAFNEPSYTVFLDPDKIDRREVLERNNQYFKAPQCDECSLKERCAGLNARYVMIHGYDELMPVIKDSPEGHAIMQIENRCNQECPFCSVEGTIKSSMTFGEVKEMIDFFLLKGVRNLTFSGGEPTLNKDIIRMLEYAKEKGIKKINLQTNGILLSNKGFLDKITGSFPVDFLISYHSSDRKTYEIATGRPKYFDLAGKALININNLDYGHHGIGIVISSLTYKGIKDTIKEVHETYKNIRFFNLIFIDPVNKALENPETIVRMSLMERYLYDALLYVRNNKLKLAIDRLPLCYLRGYEEYSAGARSIISSSPNLYFKINDQEYEYSNLRHTYNDDCKVCTLKPICGGVPKNYIDTVGDDERYPVFDSLDQTAERIRRHIQNG